MENYIFHCLVERRRGREKWWGPKVFSPPPSKYNLSKLEWKVRKIFGQIKLPPPLLTFLAFFISLIFFLYLLTCLVSSFSFSFFLSLFTNVLGLFFFFFSSLSLIFSGHVSFLLLLLLFLIFWCSYVYFLINFGWFLFLFLFFF